MRIAKVLMLGAALAGLMLRLSGLAGAAEPWDVRSDTWVATDALGRSLPAADEVGPPRPSKSVGIFYFLWHGESGDAGPFDVSKILAQDPAAIRNPRHPLWGPRLYMPHHWGESIFGYYRGDDESVLCKHAQMLADAGVDAVFFDVTNQATYPRSWQALGRVFDRVRRDGNRVPQIGFLCPFGEPRKVVRELWEQLYSRGLYPELWFRWDGRPLILADPALVGEHEVLGRRTQAVALAAGHTLGQTFTAGKPFTAVGGQLATWGRTDSAATLTLYRSRPGGERLATRRVEKVVDNAWTMLELNAALPPGPYYLELSEPASRVGWWGDPKDVVARGQALADGAAVAGDRLVKLGLPNPDDDRILRFFTFRKPQPDYFQGPTGPGQWGWLEVHPQHAFYQTPGVPEEVAVGVAQNAADGKVSVLSNPRSHGRSFHDGRQPGPEGQDTSGRNFAEQWRRALAIDPAFVFVTSWNEWFAGRFGSDAPFYGSGPVTFVDEFNTEYSRDVEPMKGGHGDNYYYQLVANIRRFKGVRPLPPIDPRPIQIDGRFQDWGAVQPEYRDTIGDPVHRDHPGWGKTLRYVDQTGRNDLVAAKVSVDARNVYFYVRTREKLTPATDPNWMLLFIDGDNNPKTGWLGYDVVVNRKTAGEAGSSLERNVGGRYEWNAPEAIGSRVAGHELELAVPRTALGLATLPAAIDFKWADNAQQTGDWSDFTLHGDAAPNDRFNYRANLRAAAP